MSKHPAGSLSWILTSAIGLLLFVVIGCGDDGVTPEETDGGPELDKTPPSAVTDLHQRTPTYESVALVWTAPGDDGTSGTASRYDIRYSKSEITEENWDSADPLDPAIVPTPKPSGQIETIVVTKLESGMTYYFALKSADEKDNESDLSNNASGSTLAEAIPPADVTDLVATATGEGSFVLTWTAPGDDHMTGTAAKYDLRYYFRAIVSEEDFARAVKVDDMPPPKPAGQTETFEITGLAALNYFFVIKTADELDNWSGMSNGAPGLAVDKYLWVAPNALQTGNETFVTFRASPTDFTRVSLHDYIYNDLCGESVLEDLVFEILPEGAHTLSFDFFNDETQAYYEPRIYLISVCWGGVMIASAHVVLNP